MNPQILAAIVAVAGAVSALCALIPAATKAKNPRLWTLLESIAVNVGKAKNADGPAGNGALTLVTYALALSAAFLPASKPVEVVPLPAVTFVAALPADPTATALSVAVSPAADVTQ